MQYFVDAAEALAIEAAFWGQGLEDPYLSVEQLGGLSLTVCRKTRAVAIIILVTRSDALLFAQNLIRSGRVRLTYLQRLRKEGIEDDHHSASSRLDPLFDAIAAADFNLANEIIALSRTEWLEGSEYEDDFCYAQLVHGLVTGSLDATSVKPLFERFETVLDGQPSARLDICRAIYANDHADFEKCFEALIEDRARQIQADKDRFEMEDPEVLALRQIFVEGYAILKLAEIRGLKADDEYSLCPSIGRIAVTPEVREED